jgi:hypothetical protein
VARLRAAGVPQRDTVTAVPLPADCNF